MSPARKQQRADARAAAHGQQMPAGEVRAVLVLHPPNRRSFDLDGASSALKGAVDGVFDAVGRDDSDIAELRVRRGCVVPGGAVDLLFTAHEPGLLD